MSNGQWSQAARVAVLVVVFLIVAVIASACSSSSSFADDDPSLEPGAELVCARTAAPHARARRR